MNVFKNHALKVRNSLNQGGDYGFISHKNMGDTIPKIIHQTYYSKELPTSIQDNVQKLKSTNPSWTHKLYDDNDIDNYIAKRYPSLFPVYKQIDSSYGAAKADFFRYLVMYDEGGVYLDIKSGANLPLDAIIKPRDKYLLSYWPDISGKKVTHPGITNPCGELQQWHIIAVKGHPYLKAVIENVCNNIKQYNPLLHDVGLWGVLNLTGPIAYTQAITPLINSELSTVTDSHESLNLVYSVTERDLLSPLLFKSHHTLFKKMHYSKKTNPIIVLKGLNKIVYILLNPIISKFTQRLRNNR